MTLSFTTPRRFYPGALIILLEIVFALLTHFVPLENSAASSGGSFFQPPQQPSFTCMVSIFFAKSIIIQIYYANFLSFFVIKPTNMDDRLL